MQKEATRLPFFDHFMLYLTNSGAIHTTITTQARYRAISNSSLMSISGLKTRSIGMAVVKRTSPILDRKLISWVLLQLEQLIGL